jgi:superfamily II DNA/RNA helicase
LNNEVPFSDFALDQNIIDALANVGIINTFPIQAMTLPLALSGSDLIGQAKTGTGKTLGFGLPLIQQVLNSAESKNPRALVIAPTRELALQVTKDLQVAAAKTSLRIESFFGGRAIEPQVDALKRGVDIAVGTPGRLLDLTVHKHLSLAEIKVLVLDEADEMLDMGFLPDVEKLVRQTPDSRQTMLFSATMPGQIVTLARRYMTNPTHVRAVNAQDETSVVDAIEQHVWRAHPLDKPELVGRILQAEGRNLAIIFCKTKRTAQNLHDDLKERGFAVGAIHGDLGQSAREQALRAFRSGKIDILVATDVAARGIDVEGITHVINYECPEDDKAYTHRIGRTGRAGSDGVAVTLVDWHDMTRWQVINKTLGLSFNEPIETYSNSEHVFTGLHIAPGTKGRLKSTERAGLDAEEMQNVEGDKKHKPQQRGRNDRRDGNRGDNRGSQSRNNSASHKPRESSSEEKPRAQRDPNQKRVRRRVTRSED